MSDQTWTTTSSKRKSTGNIQNPRKRARRSEGASDTSNSRKSQDQQTLTQIAFVHTSSGEEEDAISNHRPRSADPARRRSSKPPRILKRDSTLTQMDFLGGFSSFERPEKTEQESSMRPPPARRSHKKLKKRDSTLTQMDFFNMSMDGSADFDDAMLPDLDDSKFEPQLRSNKETHATAIAVQPLTPSTKELTNSEEAQKIKRKRIRDETTPDTGKRRRSSRLAAATSPSAEMTAESARLQLTTTPNSRRRLATAPRRPLLEIQDSTDFLEVPLSQITSSLVGKLPDPSTPKRYSRSIPSSQTPESIRRSTAKHPTTPEKQSQRPPLSELSTNVRRSHRKAGTLKSKTSTGPYDSASNKAKSRKTCIVTLKLPQAKLATLVEKHDQSDQEHDIYSLQPTSSPAAPQRSSQEPVHMPDVIGKHTFSIHAGDSNSGPTIKETASSLRDFDSQHSLPDIADILGMPRKSDDMIEKKQTLFEDKPTNMIPELHDVTSDELSDLGSPVANDTQFVRHLHDRLSSPICAPPSSSLFEQSVGSRVATVPIGKGLTPPTVKRIAPFGNVRRSPLPAPELVFTSPVRNAVRQDTGSSNTAMLPSLTTESKTLESVKISFLPLNDTAEYHRSSSPSLPLAPVSTTQKSGHPASIPHPSQVSTQAASQGYFSSSAPQTLQALHDSEVERIIIKDSSSVPPRVSQLLGHPDDLRYDDELRLEESQDEDDLDLDLSKFRPKSAGKSSRATQVNEPTEDITQTPTQKSRRKQASNGTRSSTQSSPIILAATTRSQRDAKLEIIPLTSSSSPLPSDFTPKRHVSDPQPDLTPSKQQDNKGKGKDTDVQKSPPSSSISSSLYSPSPPRDLKRKYSPLPGFDNDTQSDYTQGGHVTAAYVHRMWDRGDLPRSFVPKPYKVKNFRPSMRDGNKSGSKNGQ